MFPKIFLIEKEPELLDYYAEGIQKHGFTEVIKLLNANNIIEEIAKGYTRPSIIVSGYFLSSKSPSAFLPELTAKGYNIPAVVISGQLQAEQLNALSLQTRIWGFFPKDVNPKVLVSQLCHQLNGLIPEANESWNIYKRKSEARSFIKNMTIDELIAIKELLLFVDVKMTSTSFGKSEIYDIRKEATAFISQHPTQEYYIALYNATINRIEALEIA